MVEPKTPKTRGKAACEECRANKLRCIPPPDGVGLCERCRRQGLTCRFAERKKRGRPSKASAGLSDTPVPASHSRPRINTKLDPSTGQAGPSTQSQPAGAPVGPGVGQTTDHAQSLRSSFEYPASRSHPNPTYNSFDPLLGPGAGASALDHQSSQYQSQSQSASHVPPSPAFWASASGRSQPGSLDAGNHSHPMGLTSPNINLLVQSHGQAPGQGPGPGQGQGPADTPSTAAGKSESAADINMSVSDMLDPNERSVRFDTEPKTFFVPRPQARHSQTSLLEQSNQLHSEHDDPVALRMLSVVEAQLLLEFFFDRLNPLIAVLDPKLHTMQYLRSTSTVLFTSLLAAASKFTRRDLYPPLLSHAQVILDRALASGGADIGMIQTLMVLTYYKSPTDTSAWRKIGLAIRMGYQFRWHLPRMEALPGDELEARKILNAERTWMCLFCFDRALAWTFGLPTTIRLTEISDAEAWAREHVHFGPSVDMHLAASHELIKLKDHWYNFADSEFSAGSYLETSIESMVAYSEAFLSKWYGGNPPPGFDPKTELVVQWSMWDFILVLRRQALENQPRNILRLDACLATASTIVDQVEAAANEGWLVVLQDTAACMTSALTVLLHKLFRRCSTQQKSLILTLLQRLLQCHERVSVGSDDDATAFVARFLKRTIWTIGSASRAASRRSSPRPEGAQGELGQEQGQGQGQGQGLALGNSHANANGTGTGAGEPDIFAELSYLIEAPYSAVEVNPVEEQYWASLFSVDPTNDLTNMVFDNLWS